jgi:hypothetical protein
MQTYPRIRRRKNGTIDIDAYRQRALAERAQYKTEFVKYLGRVGRSLIAAVAGACAMLLPRSAPPACAGALHGVLAAHPCPTDFQIINEATHRKTS